jgi:hypothetical protein
LVAYLAEDTDPAELTFDEDEDVDGLDDGEIFFEVKTARFLAALDLDDGVSQQVRMHPRQPHHRHLSRPT